MIFFKQNMNFLADKHREKLGLDKKITFHKYSKIWGVHHLTVSSWFHGKIPYQTNLNMLAQYFSKELGIEISAEDLITKDLSIVFKQYASKKSKMIVSEAQLSYFNFEQFTQDLKYLSPEARDIIFRLVAYLKKLDSHQNERG